MNDAAIVEACKTAASLMRFVMGNGFKEAVLSIVGETHAASAAFALGNVQGASKPDEEVRLALGHLQTAHIAQRGIWGKFYNTVLGSPTRYHTAEVAAQTDQKICSLMAICYLALQEKHSAARALSLAAEARSAVYATKGLGGVKSLLGMFICAVDPREYKVLFGRKSGDEHDTVYFAAKRAVEEWTN